MFASNICFRDTIYFLESVSAVHSKICRLFYYSELTLICLCAKTHSQSIMLGKKQNIFTLLHEAKQKMYRNWLQSYLILYLHIQMTNYTREKNSLESKACLILHMNSNFFFSVLQKTSEFTTILQDWLHIQFRCLFEVIVQLYLCQTSFFPVSCSKKK